MRFEYSDPFRSGPPDREARPVATAMFVQLVQATSGRLSARLELRAPRRKLPAATQKTRLVTGGRVVDDTD